MSSPKFERVKKLNPRIAELLDRLGTYVGSQVRSGQSFVVPKLAAAALGLNDGETFVLLEVLAAGGVLRRVYNLYCRKTGVLLATVDDPAQLDEVPHCDFCDEDHGPPDLRVEVAFVLDDVSFTRAA